MDPQAFEPGTTGKASLADSGSVRSGHKPVRDLLIAGGLATGLIAAILAVGCFRYGDVPSFLAAIRGEDIVVSVQELAERADGELRLLAFNVRIKNLTMRSFRVLGINDTCDCLSVEGIPTTVGARESKVIVVKLRLSAGQSPTTDVALITDDAHLNQIRVALLQPRSPG